MDLIIEQGVKDPSISTAVHHMQKLNAGDFAKFQDAFRRAYAKRQVGSAPTWADIDTILEAIGGKMVKQKRCAACGGEGESISISNLMIFPGKCRRCGGKGFEKQEVEPW